MFSWVTASSVGGVVATTQIAAQYRPGTEHVHGAFIASVISVFAPHAAVVWSAEIATRFVFDRASKNANHQFD